jgi:hypothetical protein
MIPIQRNKEYKLARYIQTPGFVNNKVFMAPILEEGNGLVAASTAKMQPLSIFGHNSYTTPAEFPVVSRSEITA